MSKRPQNRSERRTETHRICSKRHARWSSPPFNWGVGVKEPGHYAKHSGGCNCSKYAKGRPRLAGGMCGIGLRDRVYIWRRLTREIDLAIRQGADPYGDYVSCLDQRCNFPNYMIIGPSRPVVLKVNKPKRKPEDGNGNC